MFNNTIYNTIARLKTKAEKEIKKEEEDYLDSEGILICGKCHTPKQFKLKISKDNFLYEQFKNQLIPSRCKCMEEERKKEEERTKRQEKEILVKRLKEKGITNKTYLEYRFEKDDGANKKITNACKRYVEKFEEISKKNIGLIFYGPVGTGKTFYACCIANEIVEQGKSVLVGTMSGLIEKMRYSEEEKNYVKNQISKVALLVIDDFGQERETSYALEKAKEIINLRYLCRKPMIITTNLKKDEIMNPKNEEKLQMYTRIEERCCPIPVLGENRRKKEARNKDQWVYKFLELN